MNAPTTFSRLPTPRTLFLVLVALALAGLGFAAQRSVQAVLHGWSSTDWPRVTGSVRSAEVTQGCGRDRHSWQLLLAYDYNIDGFEHRGSRIAFARDYCGSREGAEALRATYAPGTAVTVSFNPTRPAEAVLLPGNVDATLYAGVAVCLAAMLLVLALPWRLYRGRLKVRW